MKQARTSLLGYALLGLIHHKPQSGYGLRKVFSDTAMGNYSDSPGAIYPALQRLEKNGSVSSMVEEAGGLRRRRVYRLTSSGRAELKAWLRKPIAPDDVKRDAAELMLRFSFMEKALGTQACVAFLRSFSLAIPPYIEQLEAFLAANSAAMPLSARLALENGIRGYQSMYEWTKYAVKQFERQSTNSAPRPTTKGGSV
jgi:DNA-binding PadR family transcriptional regulator